MRIITYEQVWNSDHFCPDMDTIARTIFADSEDIQWLVGNGFMPEFLQFEMLDLDQKIYSVKFSLPDEVLTKLMLLFPEHEHRVEF